MFKKFNLFSPDVKPHESLLEHKKEMILATTENLSQMMIGEFKEAFPINLSQNEQKTIENRLQSVFDVFDGIEAYSAIRILNLADKMKDNCIKPDTAYYSLFSLIRDLFKLNTEQVFGLSSCEDVYEYIHLLINRKIIEIAVEQDIIGSLLTHSSMDKVIECMNRLSMAVYYLKHENHSGKRYNKEQHMDCLNYLLLDKELSPKEIIEEFHNLTSYQATALKQFYDKGLRGRHLRCFEANEERGDYFSYEHIQALEYLINDQGLSACDAMLEIKALSKEQVKVLIDLFAIGMRGEFLSTWDPSQYAVFGEIQAKTLEYLIVDCGLSPKNAVAEINQLSHQCCHVLQKLYSLGLRGEHFRQKALIKYFSCNSDELYGQALIALVQDRTIPVEIAVDEIKKVENQAWFVFTLGELYHLGLRAEDFKHYESSSNDTKFGRNHSEALVYLVKKKGLTTENAVKEISKLSDAAANAIATFYELGLRGSDLRNWNYNGSFSFQHVQALAYFIKLQKISVAEALKVLKTMSPYELCFLEPKFRQKLKEFDEFKTQQNLSILGLFGSGASFLKKLSNDEIFERNTVKIVFDYLRPNTI